MNIEEFIPNDRYITKLELQDMTGMSEREVRREISNLKKKMVILSLSSGKGYKRVKPTDEMSQAEMEIEYEEVNHCIREYNHRIKDFKKSMRKLVARKKILEKFIEKEQ